MKKIILCLALIFSAFFVKAQVNQSYKTRSITLGGYDIGEGQATIDIKRDSIGGWAKEIIIHEYNGIIDHFHVVRIARYYLDMQEQYWVYLNNENTLRYIGFYENGNKYVMMTGKTPVKEDAIMWELITY